MMKFVLLVGVVGVGVASFGAGVVHDAGLDLMMNARSANVYTNRFGGEQVEDEQDDSRRHRLDE